MQLTRRRTQLLLMAVIALLITSGATAQARQESQIFKYETVYTTLKSDGVAEETTVVDWLRVYGAGSHEIVDPARVWDIRNLRGPEVPVKSPQGLVWKFNSTGIKDIQYSAKTDMPLPVKINITYHLNGKPVKAEDIAGKSGRVDVRIKVTNCLGPYKPDTGGPAVYMPMTVSSVVEVQMDRCTDVRSETAMSTLIGSKMRFQWLLFPDPVVEFGYSFESNRIEFSPLDIVVIPRMPPSASFDFAAQLIPLQDGLEELDIALGEVISGSHLIYKNQNELTNGLIRLEKGVTDLMTLSRAHQQILTEVEKSVAPFSDDMILGVKTGLQQLSDALTAAYDGAGQLRQLNQAHLEVARQLKNGLDTIDLDEITELPKGTEQVQDGLTQVEDGLRLLAMANEGQAQVVRELYQANIKAFGDLAAMEKKNRLLAKSKELQEMKVALQMQIMVLHTLINGGTLEGQRIPGLLETSEGATLLANGLRDVNNGIGSMSQAISEKADGLIKGLEEMKGAVGVLVDGGTIQGQEVPGLGMTDTGLATLQEGLVTIKNSTSGFMAQIDQFLGFSALRGAIATLLRGGKVENQAVPGINTMISGLSELSAGVRETVNGSRELGKGQLQLSQGIGQVRTEGVVPIRTAVKEGVEQMSRQNAAVGMMVRKVKSYDTFTGKPANAIGEVRFLFRIYAIKPKS